MLSHPLDPGCTEEVSGLPVPLETQKNQCACVCWGFPASVAAVSVMEEVPFGVKGYNDEVDGLCVNGDMDIFGYGVRLGWL